MKPGIPSPPEPSAYDRRLGELLRHAAQVFCEKGYAAASMRDLSRSSGMSLAGLYHYFDSKERLLYLIQKQTFTSVLRSARERLERVKGPEDRVRVFILNHLEFFLEHKEEMKVLSHEEDILRDAYGSEVRAIRREYYRLAESLVDDLKRARGLEFESRIAVLSLFGMINWIYTWHHPRVDADAEALARRMSEIFLNGVIGSRSRRRK
jgi:AcrR family transcriptional regulator